MLDDVEHSQQVGQPCEASLKAARHVVNVCVLRVVDAVGAVLEVRAYQRLGVNLAALPLGRGREGLRAFYWWYDVC